MTEQVFNIPRGNFDYTFVKRMIIQLCVFLHHYSCIWQMTHRESISFCIIFLLSQNYAGKILVEWFIGQIWASILINDIKKRKNINSSWEFLPQHSSSHVKHLSNKKIIKKKLFGYHNYPYESSQICSKLSFIPLYNYTLGNSVYKT